MKKVSRVFEKQSNLKGVTYTDMRACFNRLTWIPAMNVQHPPLGMSHLILGNSQARDLQNLSTSWITTVMAFAGATVAQMYRMVEQWNPGKIVDIIILIGTNNVPRKSDSEEAQWDSMLVCLFNTKWQTFQIAALTVCTIPISKRTQSSTGRTHDERVIRWNNVVQNLAICNAGQMILMD